MSAYRNITRHILACYRRATEEEVERGLAWYDEAFTRCEVIGWRHGVDVLHSAVACAHLSPRQRWAPNLMALESLLGHEQRPPWVLRRSWEAAAASLRAECPLDTFSTRARKTQAFARAILGDRQAVTVDTWIARVAGVSEHSIRSHAGYLAVSEGFARAARIAQLSARDLQAITWCQVRGTAF